MIEGAKEKRQYIVLTLTDQVSIFEHRISNHVKMESIRMLLVILLVHTLVQHMCALTNLFNIRPVLFHTGLKLLIRH